jgi:hypothetical protein
MSTHAYITIRAHGACYTQYVHWDGGPEGVGARLSAWCDRYARLPLAERARIREALANARVVTEVTAPGWQDFEAYGEFRDDCGRRGSDVGWYELLRGMQGDIDAIVRAGIVLHEPPEAGEWIYTIDLNRGCLTSRSPDDRSAWLMYYWGVA